MKETTGTATIPLSRLKELENAEALFNEKRDSLKKQLKTVNTELEDLKRSRTFFIRIEEEHLEFKRSPYWYPHDRTHKLLVIHTTDEPNETYCFTKEFTIISDVVKKAVDQIDAAQKLYNVITFENDKLNKRNAELEKCFNRIPFFKRIKILFTGRV